jgi:hypothetical protein
MVGHVEGKKYIRNFAVETCWRAVTGKPEDVEK